MYGQHAQPAGNERTLTQALPHLCCRLLGLTLFIGLLAGALSQFKESWDVGCDYDAKIWVVVFLGKFVLQMTLAILIWILDYRDRSRSLSTRKGLHIFKAIACDLFGFAWWLYGIKPVLVDSCPSDAGASHSWGQGLWWTQFAIYALGCCFACCLAIYVVNQQRHGLQSEPAATSNPTPPDVLASIPLKRWSEVKHHGVEETAEPAARGGAPGGGQLNESAETFGHLSGVPLTETMEGLRRGFTRQQSRQTPAAPAARRDKPVCPICFAEFEDEEMVMQLPCNRKHVFHDVCIKSWLESSQQCPVCRRNVVELMSSHQEAAWENV